MKLNRKGFTLIELLSVIVIISLISGITITVALGAINNAKRKSQNLTLNNITNQAEKYIYEGISNKVWSQDSNSEREYQCVTVKELVEAGYFKNDIFENNQDIENLNENSAVKLTRNKKNKAIVSKQLQNYSTDECTQVTTNNTVINCTVPSGIKREKLVTITYSNSENNVKNGAYFNKISYAEIDGNTTPTFEPGDNKYYIAKSNQITVKAISNGSIYANSISGNNQIGSVTCIVNGIDREKPTVTITSESAWINKSKTATILIEVEDSDQVNANSSMRIDKNKIKLYVEDTETGQIESIVYDANLSNPKTAYFQMKIKGVEGNGKLSVKFLANTFTDVAGNGNAETQKLDTLIMVDNITPGLSVIDSNGANCNNGNCSSTWHPDGYKVTSNVIDDGTGSPIVGGYFGTNDVTASTFDRTQATDFPKINSDEVNGKYMYIMDEAGNFAKFGPYQVKIDRNAPTISVSTSGSTITCNITDSESGVKSYKLCKQGTTNCIADNPNGYTNFTSNPITQTDSASGVWYCFGKDNVENVAYKSIIVNNPPGTTISVTFAAKKINSSGGEIGDYTSGSWTKNNVRLKGTITSNVEASYIINNSSSNPSLSSSEWKTGTVITQDITGDKNTTYYLHIKYNDNGTWKILESSSIQPANSINVKIDQTPPTCNINITTNNSASGISATIGCTDSGSGCNSSTKPYTSKKATFSYTIEDKVTNTKECKVKVTLEAKKKYCKESNYNERCMTYDNYNDSGESVTWYTNPSDDAIKKYVTCKSGYDKVTAKYQFRYYIRRTRTEWMNKVPHNNNVYDLKSSSAKQCTTKSRPSSWEKVQHTQGDDNGKYFWYAKNPGSGSAESPLARAIKGIVVCGSRPNSTSYPNLSSFNFSSNYSSVKTDNFPTSSTDRIKHKGYSCQYESTSNEACPSGVNTLNKLVIPTTNGYYIEDENANPSSGPNNWNGQKWFTCTGKYVGTPVS